MNMNDCKNILTENDKIDVFLSCDISIITKSTLTQKEWAEKLGVSEATISSWISAQKIPSIAEKAIQYELLKSSLKKYENHSNRSIIVEENGKFAVYSIPSFNFDDARGKLIAETTIPSIARFITKHRDIMRYLKEYRDELDDKLLYADASYEEIVEDTLFDIEELLYYIQTGKSRFEGIETLFADKNPTISRSRDIQEYTMLQIIPDGTELRMIKTKGKSKGEYYAKKINGYIVGKSNKKYCSLSGAALGEIGFGSWNGWTDWECFDQQSQKWIKASLMRKNARNKNSDTSDYTSDEFA